MVTTGLLVLSFRLKQLSDCCLENGAGDRCQDSGTPVRSYASGPEKEYRGLNEDNGSGVEEKDKLSGGRYKHQTGFGDRLDVKTETAWFLPGATGWEVMPFTTIGDTRGLVWRVKMSHLVCIC